MMVTLPPDSSDIYVIFHGRSLPSGMMSPCPDGIAAAWAVNHHLKRLSREVKAFFCCDYGWAIDRYPQFSPGDFVYVVDFSFPLTYYQRFSDVAMCTFDHHKKAYELLFAPELETQINGKFDINESGATLTWKALAQAIADRGQEQPLSMPHFLAYVRDRDIWTKQLDGCDAVFYLMSSVRSAINQQFKSLGSQDDDQWVYAQFEFFDALNDIDQTPAGDPYQVMATMGKAIDKSKRLKANAIASKGKSYRLTLKGVDSEPQQYSVRAVTIMPEDAPLVSYIGEALHNQAPVVGMVNIPELGKVELRSPKDYPCLPVASYFGGGGHDCACGFSGHVSWESEELLSSEPTIQASFISV